MSFPQPPEFSPLGKTTAYASDYDPSLLFPIDRQEKRKELGIEAGSLPFVGEDLWNAYELSWLNPRGKPVVAVGTFRVPADSPRLIESKSLKLYLNSLNQTPFADPETVRQRMVTDLSAASGAPVAVTLQSLSERPSARIAYPDGILLDTLEVDCDVYHPAPERLVTVDGDPVEETLYSHLLKSNCLVTGQPDWAMLVLHYRGRPIHRAGLLQYLVSFRNHNEFHEQCVERIFCDVMRQCRPDALAVQARYTRRGGLDINPFRQTGGFAPPGNDREVRQ